MGFSAIIYGRYNFLLFVFKFISNVNILTFKAAMNRHNLIVIDLIAAGADVNLATNYGVTSLMFGEVKILFILIK